MVEFISSEADAITGSLQNNCSKQQIKPSRKACILWKDFLMDVLLHNKPRKTKIKTSTGKIKFLRCQCWCRYFQMVLRKYSNCKNSGTGNWAWALFLEYSYYLCLISLKLKNLARRWITAWRFQIFLMATHLFVFIHDVLYAHRQHKNMLCC